jgi:phosphatidate cytidylyltransferase
MLKQRVITAIVLLAILLPALFWRRPSPSSPSRCADRRRRLGMGPPERLAQGASIALGAVTLALCAGAWALGWPQRPRPAVAWSAPAGCWPARPGARRRRRLAADPARVRVAGGVLALALAWLAMAQARVIGVNFLLSILVLVWVADIFAYFAGRAFGGKFTQRKLAPVISPRKAGKACGAAWPAWWCWPWPGRWPTAPARPRCPASIPRWPPRLAVLVSRRSSWPP